MGEDDVPTPIDFHDPAQCRAWVDDTIRMRPYRPLFFAAFASALNVRFDRAVDVLELGSGPGHLAEALLMNCHIRSYTALDFSVAMHDLARERLAPFAERMTYVQRDFRLPDWTEGLGLFDAVVTLQAAHETRHKRHLVPLLSRAKRLLATNGVLLYADHYAEPGSGKNPDLMAAKDEQIAALNTAGFRNADRLLDEGGMALYSASGA